MDETTARARIVLELKPDSSPVLTESEVDALVVEAGFTPDGGTLGYTMRGVYRAICLGWRTRCNGLVGQFDVKADTVEAKRSQQIEACLRVADRYASLSTKATGAEGEPDANGLTLGVAGNIGVGSVTITRSDWPGSRCVGVC